MARFLSKYRSPAFLVVVMVLIWICYGQTLNHGFFWDTNHIFKHDALRSFELENLHWIFTNTVVANWHPLSLMTHMLDFQLYGWDPFGHHLTNIIIHLLVCLLVFFAIRQLVSLGVKDGGSAFYVAAITTLLFALHPLRVESVAWVAARKDLLYSVFFLLSIILYVAYVQERGLRKRWFYGLSILCFALSLLSKSMAVTLPAVLILLDQYPLNRLNVRRIGGYVRNGLIDKLPYFVLSGAAVVVTLTTQSEAMGNQLSILDELRNAIHNVVFYIERLAAPVGLVPFYPFPSAEEFNSLGYWLPQLAFIVALTLFACVGIWRGNPLFGTCWLLYLAMLSPASGVIQVGSAAAADRYTYLSQLPILLMLAMATVWFYLQFEKLRRVVVVVGLLGAITMTSLTFMQVTHWRSSITLWSHVLRTYPGASLARRNLSTSYFEVGDYERALFHIDVLALQGWPVAPLLVQALDATEQGPEWLEKYTALLREPNLTDQQRVTYLEVVRLLQGTETNES